MPNRFSTPNDYSQTFAYLYQQNTASLEAAANRVDAQREAEQASKDALIFTKWQEGKISGGELMAYINQRMRQTSYDKEQQNKWREAAIQYGTQISDDQAEADYAKTGNISALIGHYAARLGQTSKGTPEFLELTQRLKTLRDQRDADSLRKQANRLERAIARGDKTTKDLISFYQDQLKILPSNSPMREEVLNTLTDLRVKQRNEQFEIAMTKIDTALATGQVSPAVAAAQKQDVLIKYDIETTAPADFWKWQESIRVLRATPDPAELAQLEFDLAAGNISTEQYITKIEEYADRIAPFDLQASWELLTEAQKLSEANELPNPGALGLPAGGLGVGSGSRTDGFNQYSGTIEVVRKLTGNAIKHITQMDGSAYSEYNCTMASGAMLANAMGATGLTGADLRYLSGVTMQATNIQQLQSALEAAGVDGTRLSWENRIEFEKFKQRLANGAPAVLSGWLGDIPAQLNTAGVVTGHAMFVATYDPKRNAFLMLDPAKSSDPGTWWPADIVENFGWGGARDGQALFAPKNTVDPVALTRSSGTLKHISVNAKPLLPGTPMGAGGQFDPGPDAKYKLAQAQQASATAEQKRLQRRLKDAGIEVGPDLNETQEVEAELQRRWDSYYETDQVVSEWVAKFAENGQDTQTVVLGGQRTTLSVDDVRQMQSELLLLLDGQEIFYDALEMKDKVGETRKMKAEIVTEGVGINSIPAQAAIGRLESEANAILGDIGKLTDPMDVLKSLGDLGGIMEQLGGIEDVSGTPWGVDQAQADMTQVEEQQVELREGVSPEIKKQQGYYAAASEIIRNSDMTRDERVDAIIELSDTYGVNLPNGWPDGTINPRSGDPAGRLITESLQRFDEMILLGTRDPDDGLPLGKVVMIGGEMVVLPTKHSQRFDTNTGAYVPDREVVIDYLPSDVKDRLTTLGINAKSLPQVVVNGPGGLEMRAFIPDLIPYEGVVMVKWGKLTDAQKANLPIDIQPQYSEGGLLTEDLLNHPYLDRATSIPDLLSRGVLIEVPFLVERYLSPEPGGKFTAWYKDAGTGRWHKNNLPFIGRSTTSKHQYTGAEVDAEGRAFPQLVLDSGDMDLSDSGLPVPHQGTLTPRQVGEYVRNQETIGFNIDPLRRRDLDGSIIEYDRLSPEYVDQWGKSYVSMTDAIKALDAGRLEARNKLATVLPPNEAADMAFWTEQDQRERARQMGVDFDTGRWLPGTSWNAPDQPPSQEMLDELGIVVPERLGPPQDVPKFDPLGIALRSAKGVAAANRAEQDRLRAEAVSTAKTGISTLPKVTAPVTSPPAGGATSNPASSIRLNPLTPVKTPVTTTTPVTGATSSTAYNPLSSATTATSAPPAKTSVSGPRML